MNESMLKADLLHAHAMHLEEDGEHRGAGEVYQEAAMHYRAASLHIEPLEGKAEQIMRRAKNMLGLAWAKTCAEGIILALSAAYIVVHVLSFALRAQEIGLLRALGL